MAKQSVPVPEQGNDRGSFGSNIGFLLSAIGSAVGLGNIWGFPYKMGKSGGFSFLLIYLLLAIFVGFVIMLGELALGRKTGFGPVNAYAAVSKKFKWAGWLGVIVPFLVMTFYSVLGGYCIYYIIVNVIGLFSGGAPGNEVFGALLTTPGFGIGCTLLFMLICYFINRNGVGGGIEKFNEVGMPALFVLLVVVIIRSLTMPYAQGSRCQRRELRRFPRIRSRCAVGHRHRRRPDVLLPVSGNGRHDHLWLLPQQV